jgi:hypothetical protein
VGTLCLSSTELGEVGHGEPAPVAQWIEQDGPNVKAGGSIPSGGAYVRALVATIALDALRKVTIVATIAGQARWGAIEGRLLD